MKFYPRNIVEKARKLRRKGLSAEKIEKQLGVRANTILRWCMDIPSNNPTHLLNQQWRDRMREKGIESINSFNFTPKQARIFASLLYWCEGCRYPASTFVGFSNSDVSLVKTFLEFFRKGFQPKENKLRVHLQLHTTHDKKKMTTFWSKLLKIPKKQFFKPTITPPTGRMKRFNYKGTCAVRYYDLSVLLEMMGIYEELSRKI